MVSLLPSIVDMQRHITGEVGLLRQNMHKLEDALGQIAKMEPVAYPRSMSVPTAASPPMPVDPELNAFVANLTQDVLNIDLKLDQYIAHFQAELSHKTLTLNDISSKVDDGIRSAQLNADATNQKLHESDAKIDDTYVTSRADHIRLDVLNANLQEMVSTIGTISKNIERFDTLQKQIASDTVAFRETVNARLGALETANGGTFASHDTNRRL